MSSGTNSSAKLKLLWWESDDMTVSCIAQHVITRTAQGLAYMLTHQPYREVEGIIETRRYFATTGKYPWPSNSRDWA